MADISLSLPLLSDILSPIIDPPVTSSDPPTVTAPPVTVTVTLDPTSQSSASISSTSSVASHPQSSAPVSSSSSTTLAASSSSSSTDAPEFLTTTYLTRDGTSLLTITAVVNNPAGRTHDNPATNDFFANKTAVIGVFTACAIILFALIAALIAWAARRRTLKRWEHDQAEKESFDRRNFLQDEVRDEFAPSEKSWWAGASGTSIPDGANMHMQTVNALPFHSVPPPVPPLPTELSPVATTFNGSGGSKSIMMSSETIGPISHPYSGSVVSEPYHLTSPRAQHGSITSMSTIRDAARSPPPSTPLPPVPYSNRGPDMSQLPMILEGPPSASSTEGWASQIQSIPPHPAVDTPPLPPLDTRHQPSLRRPSHPYASPTTNRKSELYAGDVLMDLGSNGGVGRSLNDGQPSAKPMREGAIRGQSSTDHNTSNQTHSGLGELSASGLSDGGWYDDASSGGTKAAKGAAAASGESGHAPSNFRISMDVIERRKAPHDPRFSGLFGAWTDQQKYRQSDSMISEQGAEDDYSTPRILRVTNE